MTSNLVHFVFAQGESGIGLRFIGAAKSVASIPTHPTPLAEIAFVGEYVVFLFDAGQRSRRLAVRVGRSNVGKSSLLNALATKYIANTSAIPGKTQVLLVPWNAVRLGANFSVDNVEFELLWGG